jgi:hypothetical protein
MALSNWDLLAINEEGEAIEGIFRSEDACVEIYKNWLYFYKEGEKGFNITLYNGNLECGNLNIYAERGPQEGVFCVCTFYDRKKDMYKAMIGSGVYAYSNITGECIGTTKESFEFLKGVIERSDFEIDPNILDKNLVRYNQGDAFFAATLGTDLQETKIEEQPKETIMIKIIKNMSEE